MEAERKSKRKKKNLLRVITTLRFYSTHLFLFIFFLPFGVGLSGTFRVLSCLRGFFGKVKIPFGCFGE